MNTLSTLQSQVEQENTVIASAITLINGLAAQVAALQPNQEAINQLASNIALASNNLAAAVTANTAPVTQS